MAKNECLCGYQKKRLGEDGTLPTLRRERRSSSIHGRTSRRKQAEGGKKQRDNEKEGMGVRNKTHGKHMYKKKVKAKSK